MTTSTQNLTTAERILDTVSAKAKLDAATSIQLATAYLGLAAIKVSVETQQRLAAVMERQDDF